MISKLTLRPGSAKYTRQLERDSQDSKERGPRDSNEESQETEKR